MKIVIIGAGPAGLGAARRCLESIKNDSDSELIIIEKSDKIGGIWNGDVESPVYEDLHTNLPKELMAFPDFPFPESEKSFVHHSEVTEYLEGYARHFALKQYVKEKTEVIQVSAKSQDDKDTGWIIKTKNLQTNDEECILADLILITGVREKIPRIPKCSWNDCFTGVQMHSSQYKSPSQECFQQKSVLIIGGGLSAIDIAGEISSTASKVFISSERGIIPSRNLLTGNVLGVGPIQRVVMKRIWFQNDGNGDGENVDSIVWCTGYRKNETFFDESCGINFENDGSVVHPLYLHFININYPTMAILNMTSGNVPFPQMDLEARCFLNLHKNKLMPDQDVMWKWLNNDIKMKSDFNIAPRHRHKMNSGRFVHWFNHMKLVAQIGKVEMLPTASEKMLLYTFALLVVRGLPEARKVKFSLNSDRSSFVVAPNDFLVSFCYFMMIIFTRIGYLK